MLDAIISNMLAFYRAEIGQAYAMEDFTFTFHEAWGAQGVFFLMGPTYVARAGIPGTRKPGAVGIAGLV